MDDPKSKSQKKRDAEVMQKLGIKLIDWSVDRLDLLPLPAVLKQAIIDAKPLRSHGAIRRQAQLIGKLMRTTDFEAILAVYEQLQAEDNAQTASFHEVEHWRSRLIHEGREALTEFVNTYHPEDLQSLRQLITKAVDDEKKGKNSGATKALFRYLRSYVL